MDRVIANKKGFTLPELMVSIAIMILLMTISFMYFRKSGDSQSVRSTASAVSDVLRTAQNYAQAGKLVKVVGGGECDSVLPVDCALPAAFGVRFTSPVDPLDPTKPPTPTAIIYADIAHGTTAANNTYDPGEEYPTVSKGTIILDWISLKNQRSETLIANGTIDGINIDGVDTNIIDISFTSPSAAMKINGGIASNNVIFSLQKGTIIKTVSIDRISGRIQASF